MAKILIVDDSEFMRMRCKTIIEEQGHEVFEASNGIKALKMFQDLKPDMVFMDITMPGMDGIKCVKQIRTLDPEAIIVMVSSKGHHKLVVDAMTAGAKDFIVKPFEPHEILNPLNKLLALKSGNETEQ